MANLQLAAAIVVHHDHVLIVRRSKTEGFKPLIWGVPCGKLDNDEDPSQAVLRELAEETGLEGEVVDAVGSSEFLSSWHGRVTKNFQTNYLVRLKGAPAGTDADNMPRVTLPEKDQRSRWVRLSEIFDIDGVDEYNREIIRQGLDKIAGQPHHSGAASAAAAMASLHPSRPSSSIRRSDHAGAH
jgi:8-oxo-dGTP diphosphatase